MQCTSTTHSGLAFIWLIQHLLLASWIVNTFNGREYCVCTDHSFERLTIQDLWHTFCKLESTRVSVLVPVFVFAFAQATQHLHTTRQDQTKDSIYICTCRCVTNKKSWRLCSHRRGYCEQILSLNYQLSGVKLIRVELNGQQPLSASSELHLSLHSDESPTKLSTNAG